MIPVVLSGGSGSRLWPISRTSYPKQFCDIFDEPLLMKTLKRLSPLGQPRVVTVQTLKVLTEDTVKKLNLNIDNIIYEPSSRNTAAALALLCWKLKIEGQEDEIVGVFPADHIITEEQKFISAVQYAIECAQKGAVITMGITPNYPATGFGYIECEPSQNNNSLLEARTVLGFREKPDMTTAEKFVREKNFFWNAGMLVFKLSSMIQAFELHMPELWKKINSITSDMSNLTAVYNELSSESIDTGVMEKLKNQKCIPVDFGWNDLGSWDDFAKVFGTKESFNKNQMANVVKVNAQDNFVFSLKNKMIGLVGVEDLIVIDTPDALLVAKKGQSQQIKNLVDQLNQTKDKKVQDHLFDHRPWGKYEILSEETGYKVKVITVNPEAQISYQSHVHRSEHWVVIEGQGYVIINEQKLPVVPGSSIVIPQNSKHRIKNTGAKALRFVEVQTGDYFGEDDIQRFSDEYKRV